uniref:Uncharacterized protein n=1 Tax=Anguilla anguilla TaxID=7936 RepID=A0A0E9RE82_ANGAN
MTSMSPSSSPVPKDFPSASSSSMVVFSSWTFRSCCVSTSPAS